MCRVVGLKDSEREGKSCRMVKVVSMCRVSGAKKERSHPRLKLQIQNILLERAKHLFLRRLLELYFPFLHRYWCTLSYVHLLLAVLRLLCLARRFGSPESKSWKAYSGLLRRRRNPLQLNGACGETERKKDLIGGYGYRMIEANGKYLEVDIRNEEVENS
jgi:hypothetical protein